MKTALGTVALALAAGLSLGSAALAQADYDSGHARVLAITVVKAKSPTALKVSSPAFKDGQDIPFENTAFRGNLFPGLDWSRGPAGTQSYVVAMQGILKGGDDEQLGTSLHFVMYNIPASVTELAAGLKAPPTGAAQGSTVHGFKDIYAGPHTHSFTKHAYHLEVFALDETLPPDPKMTLAALEKAMDGHVLASGDLVGMDPTSPEAKELAAKGEGPAKTN
jgi:para-nitrobenzyl esterase